MQPNKFLFAALALLATFAGAADPKPNVLFILADDLGYADVGFNGAKEIKTPNLDKLAAAGTILTSFYVQPVCSPTRSSLMTGRYVAHTGVYQVVRPNAPWGLPLVTVKVKLINQGGTVLVDSTAEVELPLS